MLSLVALAVLANQGRAEFWIESRTAGPVLVRSVPPAEHALDRPYDRAYAAQGGRRLLVQVGADGPLGYVRFGRDGVALLAESAREPKWAPDGLRAAFVVPGKGLMVFDATTPTEPATLVDPAATAFAWAPDGSRLAIARSDGVWIVGRLGAARRRIVRDRAARALAWSPDGRIVALAEPGLAGKGARISAVRATGVNLAPLADVDALALTYSPNARSLLTQVGADWVAIDVASRRLAKIGPATAEPTWIGARKLWVPRADGSVTLEIGAEARELARSARKALAVDPQPELTADLNPEDPFRGAPTPARGQIRARGVIVMADPLDGEFTLLVDSVVDPSGKETVFARPIEQLISAGPPAKLTNGTSERPLRAIDLAPDAEAMVWLRAPALSMRRLAVDLAWVEGAEEGAALPLKSAPRLRGSGSDPDGVTHERIVVPMVFPVAGRVSWSDTFLADRAGGRRRHLGQDLMGPKMLPLVAAFDGVVRLGRGGVGGHYTIVLRGDNGWRACYYHVNNDTPGTNDGRGGDLYAFAPGLESGQRVHAGQFIGYLGNSGNAETTPPHLHFELWCGITHVVVNAAPSLRAATRVDSPIAKLRDDGLRPKPGEVRWDGLVTEVDANRGIVRASLLARTEKGRTRAVVRPESAFMRWTPAVEAHVLGNETLAIGLADVRPGLYAAWIGTAPPAGRAMAPRRAAFAAP
jgi:murein DD-endopeptidase MepM/ murein hydrolase activator NlpD